ncbi:MAG TPA: hypothetical protein PLN02_02945 [Azonexus sp.]|nr:hypothetical protein [Azonexus sp.]
MPGGGFKKLTRLPTKGKHCAGNTNPANPVTAMNLTMEFGGDFGEKSSLAASGCGLPLG